MKSVVVRSFGGPEVLEVADLPEPDVGERQVLVRVAAAPVTAVDLDIRSGELAGYLADLDYYALGRSAAGVVERVGAQVTDFVEGDHVMGVCGPLASPYAAQAEKVVFDLGHVVHAPRRATLAQASTLPLNGLTADQALQALDLPRGATVLVTGAAGCVGGFVVELARHRGLRVAAHARKSDEKTLLRMGAEHFIARDTDLATAVREWAPRGVDGVVDTAVLKDVAAETVKDGGRFVTLVIGGEPKPGRDVQVHPVWAKPDAGRLADLANLVDKGFVTPRVAEAFPLAAVAEAHARFARGNVRGHLIVKP
ncbi:zinc-binding dehydrogenase [Herbidospora sp. NEAU-GS84]|uniref:Zinc-binding dehydrogenase n=1 Tax=Herbidospora solisilvae TaxID=2696284 RepID=A0A7C9P375_9ACTN|nr:NADP-dependent oxidoreductase [Herbidospora solisilvae]NAS27357.1 zinc-binding dehydrogenase [Herbidospora solisilvae]